MPSRPHYELYEDMVRNTAGGVGTSLADECRRMGLDPANSVDFSMHPLTQSALQLTQEMGADKTGFASMPHMLQATAAFRYYGSRHYVITPRLFERLLATHLKKIPADLVKAPLRGFYLEYPEGLFVADRSFSDPELPLLAEAAP